MYFVDIYNGYCIVFMVFNECGRIDWIDLWNSFVNILLLFKVKLISLYYNYLIFYIYITFIDI